MKRLTWIIVIILTMLFWILVLVGCSKVNHPNSSVDDRIRQDRAPVKAHKPNIK